MLGMTFSTPIKATCTGGVEVDKPAFPSFSTTHSVPVSAMAKFAPETPISARMKSSRKCLRAMAVSAWCSAV